MERFEDEEGWESMDAVRCLLRELVSFGVNEGERDGEGGVSIAFVNAAVEKMRTGRSKSAVAHDAWSIAFNQNASIKGRL